MSQTKERPILFSGPMVRAILEGRKTVTRRLVKSQPREGMTIIVESFHPVVIDRHGIEQPGPEIFGAFSDDGEWGTKCPYGQPGDRLWVRETWARVGNSDPGYLTYRATYPTCLPPELENVPADIYDIGERWRPSIHMPRAACRILLEITSVRVERLQDISTEQIIAEGLSTTLREHDAVDDLKVQWLKLWIDINGAESWHANPWVWVVEFKRVMP